VLPGLWNILHLFVNFIFVQVPRLPTHLFLHSSRTYSFYLSLCTSITPSVLQSRLITCLFHKSFPCSFTSSSLTAFTDYHLDRFFWATRFLFLVFPYFLFLVPCARLSWSPRQLLRARKYSISYRIVGNTISTARLLASSVWRGYR